MSQEINRKFTVNLLLLLALNVLVKPFYIFGIDRSVQNAVGAEQYGLFYAVFNFAFLFSIFLDCGITNYNNRHIARHTHLLPKYFSGMVALRLLLGVVFVAVVFAIGFLLGYDAHHFRLLGWVAFNQFLASFLLYLRSNISGLQFFKTDSLLSVLDRLLMILFCAILLWGNVMKKPFQIEWFIYCQTLSYAIAVIVAFSLCAAYSHFEKLSFRKTFFLHILKESFPYALLVLLTSFAIPVGVVLLERILGGAYGQTQSGIYAAAYRILDAAIMIGYLVSVLLLPLFSKLLAEKQEIKSLIKTATNFLFVFSVGTSVWISLYADAWMDLLYTHHAHESAQVFRVLIFSLIPASLSYVFGTLLTANGNMKILNINAAIGIVLMLGLSSLLVPSFAALGIAYANLGVQCFFAVFQIFFTFKTFQWRCSIKYGIRLMGFAFGVLFVADAAKSLPFSWASYFCFAVCWTTLLAVLLKLWDIKSLMGLVLQNTRRRKI